MRPAESASLICLLESYLGDYAERVAGADGPPHREVPAPRRIGSVSVEWMDDWAKDWEDDPSRIDIASLVPVLRVARLGILIEAFRTEILRNFELTPREFDVLGALRGVGLARWMNPSQLYGPLHLSSGGTTKILKRLTTAGLIERSPDPADGRSMRARMTGRGRGLHDRALRAIAAASTQVLEASSSAEKTEIDTALERLLNRLDHARSDKG